MNNNDRLLRLRYAIDLKDTDLIKAFELGGVPVTKEEAQAILTKIQDKQGDNEKKNIYEKPINNQVFDAFLNGLIILARGPQKDKPAQAMPQKSKEIKHINNVLLKKLKIALSMTSEDILAIFAEVELYPSKGEIGAFLRREGQRNFKPCGDEYMRNFLKGLGIYNRRKGQTCDGVSYTNGATTHLQLLLNQQRIDFLRAVSVLAYEESNFFVFTLF